MDHMDEDKKLRSPAEEDDCCGCEGHEHRDEEEGGEGKSLILGGVLYALGLGLWLLKGESLLSVAVLIAAYLVLGGDVLKEAAYGIAHGEVFDECFLMSVSTLGALALREFPEAVAVMFFYRLGEFFEDMAVDRSERSIEALLDIRPDVAEVERNGNWVSVPAESVAIGELMLVRPGGRIALDGVIEEGSSALDTRALTGESVPRSVSVGDAALSGCINGDGTLLVRVKSGFGDSTAARVIELVRSASEHKAPSENFIHRFAKIYTPVVVALAVLLALLPPLLLHRAWTDWLRRSFVFLVISCPCALVISVPLTFLGGVGAASRRGVLVKGSNYLEALCSLDTVVFDKTGTLTEGSFEVKALIPAGGVAEAELLRCAAAAEGHSTHPIARSVLAMNGGSAEAVSEEFNYPGRGVGAVLCGQTILAGNEKLMAENGVAFTPCPEAGTVVHVARDGRYLGCLVIGDSIKKDSAAAIAALKGRGVKRLVMLTGDSEHIASSVAKELGIGEVAAGLLPDQKLGYLENLLSGQTGTLAFVGDGINDAPALSRADVGIAMGALGSDAAIEAADVVLMTDEPGKLAEALDVAKLTHRIVVENIAFALGVKLLFLLLGALGVAGMWVAVIGDVGVMLLAVLNAMRMMRK